MTVSGTPRSAGTTVGTAAGAGRSAATERREPAILLPRRRPSYLGLVHLSQLLLAEALLIAVLAAVTKGIVVAIGAAVGALALLVLTLSRREGRWWIERRLMTRRYRRRRQVGVTGEDGEDPRLAALWPLAPGLVVENVPVAGGAQIGVARDDAGWFAIAAVTSNALMRDDLAVLPLDALAAAMAEAEQPGSVLQVVIHGVPSPSIHSPASSAAGHSYRQLLASFGESSVPAERTTWIAVRLHARSLAEALGDRFAEVDTAPAVVAALIRRVTKSLHPAGISYRLLDSEGLLAALVQSCDLVLPARQPDAPREEWSSWYSSRYAHRSYWIRGWPSVDRAAGLLDKMFTVPSAMTSVAIILTPDDQERMVDLRALVRVAAPSDELTEVCLGLTRCAKRVRAELFALDGEQSPAVYASAPTGGGGQ